MSGRHINAIRHPWERFCYGLVVVLNVLMILVVIVAFAQEVQSFKMHLNDVASDRGIESLEAQEVWQEFYDYIGESKRAQIIQIYTTVFILIFFTIAVMEYFYATVRSRSIRVTQNQFGEIYELAVKYAWMMGLNKVPEIYLVQENGILNAFASTVLRKKFIQINMDLLEIAYREHGDLESIGFVLAHEMAHVRFRHVSIPIQYTIMLGQLLPIVGPALSRAREYSCDRLAQVISGNNGVDAMMALSMGKHLYKRTNVTDYLYSSYGFKGFWLWTVNLSSSHPILPKRVQALLMPSVPGKLF